jgi:hypothetical protein
MPSLSETDNAPVVATDKVSAPAPPTIEPAPLAVIASAPAPPIMLVIPAPAPLSVVAPEAVDALMLIVPVFVVIKCKSTDAAVARFNTPLLVVLEMCHSK